MRTEKKHHGTWPSVAPFTALFLSRKIRQAVWSIFEGPPTPPPKKKNKLNKQDGGNSFFGTCSQGKFLRHLRSQRLFTKLSLMKHWGTTCRHIEPEPRKTTEKEWEMVGCSPISHAWFFQSSKRITAFVILFRFQVDYMSCWIETQTMLFLGMHLPSKTTEVQVQTRCKIVISNMQTTYPFQTLYRMYIVSTERLFSILTA